MATVPKPNDTLFNGELNTPTTLSGTHDFHTQGLLPIPRNSLVHDEYHQGLPVTINDRTEWTILFDSSAEYLILVHTRSGKRMLVHAPT